MKRALQHDENRLWAKVAATVRLAPGRIVPAIDPEPELPPKPSARSERSTPPSSKAPKPTVLLSRPEGIEPQRHRRIARGRDPIDARIDLHGLTQDGARQALTAFILAAQADGRRAVLVITGKGFGGDGVLRRRTPEWLAEPGLRKVIAGLSTAERHHGGEGAFYVALKRRLD